MRVRVRDSQGRPTLGERRLERIGDVVGARLGLSPGAAGVAWVDDEQMCALHDRFRDHATTTDVLSFPCDPMPSAEDGDELHYWGDVVVCTDQAARQARDLGHPYPFELGVLVLHGFLHLQGFDHTTDRGEMTRLEEALRAPCMRTEASWS